MILQRISLVVAVLCLTGNAAADETGNAAADERTHAAPLRIALVGDSTVASYPEPPADRPSLTGWGQVLEEFFDDRVTVLNHAVSGCSSKAACGTGRGG